jgi:putative sigma-54 modulation protein
MIRYEFTGRHLTVTPALKRHAREHLDKLDKILESAPMRAHVVLEVQKHRQIAEVILQWRDHTFTATAATKDMYDSLTKVAEKIEKQLFKLKDKFTKGKRQALSTSEAATITQPAAPAAGDGDGARGDIRIVRSRRYTVKPMTPEEAAAQINDSTDQFVVFRDSETQRVGVVYKRRDGNFGLIEP